MHDPSPSLDLLSGVFGLAWPALPRPQAAAVIAIVHQLEQSQWESAETLQQKQLSQLAHVLKHANRTVPFYKHRLSTKAINLDKPLTAEKIRALPILSRTQIQVQGGQLLSQAIPKQHGATSSVRTSGSTGQPISVTFTALTQLFLRALLIRENQWRRRDFAHKLGAIRVVRDGRARAPAGLRNPGWSIARGLLASQGESVALDIHSSLAEQLDWWRREDPHYLLTYPSNLAALLSQIKAMPEVKFRNLLHIRTVSEILTSSLREDCLDTLGVPCVDEYSAQEVGSIALECADHPHYHTQVESLYVEILNNNDQPCSPGEIGRVVVSTLHNFAMPLIRYEIGDYAEVGEPCPCGRGAQVLTRILGRARNMITFPNGEKRWPLPGDGGYRAIAPVTQYQFVQTALDRFEVRLVVERALIADEETRLKEWMCSQLGYPFELDFVYKTHLERSASGKFEDFVSAIPPQ